MEVVLKAYQTCKQQNRSFAMMWICGFIVINDYDDWNIQLMIADDWYMQMDGKESPSPGVASRYVPARESSPGQEKTQMNNGLLQPLAIVILTLTCM